ncbi:hypothetical protein EYC59_04165 [Candidatus Saccharibacteria bacterium]|nr:MAG: hypothetical protein EYC59_04165 [Candidatus Saccharibacteria bacterium]
MFALKLIAFTVLWTAIIYGLNCVVARGAKRVEPKRALVYITAVAMIGVYGEIFLDTIYNAIVGRPLWYYNLLPIHGGFTSAFAPIVWGMYGFHVYLLHDTLNTKWSITRTRHLALIISLEALVLEALLTLSAKPFFGEYLYYYLPSDLWHVTSLQNMPFYFMCGVVIVQVMRRFRREPWFFSALSTFFVGMLVFAF